MKDHTLSDEVGNQPVEWSELGVAQAIRVIVKDNPALQDFISQEKEFQILEVTTDETADDRESNTQYRASKKSSRARQEAHPEGNTVSDFSKRFYAVFEEETVNPATSSETVFERSMSRLLGGK